MKGAADLRNWRLWAQLLTIWAVIVGTAFILGGSDYGYGAVVGGPAGLLGASVAAYALRHRGSVNGRTD